MKEHVLKRASKLMDIAIKENHLTRGDFISVCGDSASDVSKFLHEEKIGTWLSEYELWNVDEDRAKAIRKRASIYNARKWTKTALGICTLLLSALLPTVLQMLLDTTIDWNIALLTASCLLIGGLLGFLIGRNLSR